MKLKPILLSAALAALNSAYPVSVNWVSDSGSAFDVLITGTGGDPYLEQGWPAVKYSETITSPSGLWELTSRQIFGFKDFGEPSVQISQSAEIRFTLLALPAMVAIGYNDFLSPGLAQDGNSWNLRAFDGWSGFNPISITSLPDLTDPSTWSWAVEYQAKGPSLARRVPDYGNGGLCLAAAAAILFLFKRP